MMKRLDYAASLILLLVGLTHVAVGADAFSSPTIQKAWFISAGFFGATTALTNLARAAMQQPPPLLSIAALSGALGVFAIGLVVLAARQFELRLDPSVILLCMGSALTLFSAGALTRKMSMQRSNRSTAHPPE